MHLFGAYTDKMDPITSYVETNNLKEIEAGNSASSSANGAGLGACIDMKTAKPDRLKKGVYGHVAAGYQNKKLIVLKIGLNHKALTHEASALQAFSGLGAVKVLERVV